MDTDVMQPCGVAKLLSAIFKVPLEQSYEAAGLVCCPICGIASTKQEYYPYCGLQHQRKGTGLGRKGAPAPVIMTCEVCGIKFPRTITQIKGYAKQRDATGATGGYKAFCSKKCTGRNLGAKTHNRRSRKGQSKYDYDAIRKHRQIASMAQTLRHFNIPLGSQGMVSRYIDN